MHMGMQNAALVPAQQIAVRGQKRDCSASRPPAIRQRQQVNMRHVYEKAY